MAALKGLCAAGVLGAMALLGTACSHSPHTVCERVVEIRSIPMKGQGHDEAYLALMDAGDSVVPCLIDRISDTTPMPDPRMAPRYHGTVVGDVAVFMLVRKTGMEFSVFLPEEVKAEYRVKGVYAYFDYVGEPAHRRDLQQRWREWWGQRSR